MDPVITLATVTSGVSLLAHECAKGVAGAAGHDIWEKIKDLLGLTSEPKPGELAPAVAERLQQDQELTDKIITLLKSKEVAHSSAAALVQNVHARSVIVTETMIKPKIKM